jgi:hypothetical protein
MPRPFFCNFAAIKKFVDFFSTTKADQVLDKPAIVYPDIAAQYPGNFFIPIAFIPVISLSR